MAESSCVNSPMCRRDPRCPDLGCPERPTAVTPCDCSLRLVSCPTPEACHRPLAELQPISRRLFTQRRASLPSTREGRGRLIGAALALGGLGLFWREIVRHLFNLT